MAGTSRPHGYNRYTIGCRCIVCREAKAEYMRDRRQRAAVARQEAAAEGQQYIADGITHGYTGYQNYGCRCTTCRYAKSDAVRKVQQVQT